MSEALLDSAPAAVDRHDPEVFCAALVEHGLILPAGVQGGYGRGSVFEDILSRFDAIVARTAAQDRAETLTFPPIVARALIEKVGYMDNFPQLCGSINSFFGNEREARALSERVHAGERWEDLLAITESMLTPAACYPVYPIFSGLLREGGRLVTVMNWVYRHEPSAEPTKCWSGATPGSIAAWRCCARCSCRCPAMSRTTRSSAAPARSWRRANAINA